MDGGAWQATVYGVAKSRSRMSDSTHSLTLQSLISHIAIICGVSVYLLLDSELVEVG